MLCHGPHHGLHLPVVLLGLLHQPVGVHNVPGHQSAPSSLHHSPHLHWDVAGLHKLRGGLTVGPLHHLFCGGLLVGPLHQVPDGFCPGLSPGLYPGQHQH